MPNEPICVRRTATVEEADVVVAWLWERGVESRIMDRDNPGVRAFGVTDDEGIAICVADEALAEQAEALLDEHDKESLQKKPDPRADPARVTCDDCGKVSTFAPNLSGSVQACEHCGAYVDVP